MANWIQRFLTAIATHKADVSAHHAKTPRAATLVVAANDSLNQAGADYVCDGVNDHVEIQAALDALPATGGEVKLLDGTYNIEVIITLDSNQTLRGCGRNTILTTATAARILSAVGGAGTEKTGIVIADLQIDGATISSYGIYFGYVDYSFIQNVYSRRNTSGIYLLSSDNNIVVGNICQWNTNNGIYLNTSNNNTISGNICQGNTYDGIYITISNNNTISGNTFQENGTVGLDLSLCHHNIIASNTCIGNSQTTDNSKDNIALSASDYNLVIGNLCRDGGGANQPRYGIGIVNPTCDKNVVVGNDLYDSGKTANFYDAGTLTQVEDDNRGIEITQIKMYRLVKNTSGGALVAGDVVILKAVAAGNEITTTTTQGDPNVYGMVAEAIADNAYGLVLVKGKTIVLKVDGTTDIAIGDPLGTFTTAKIAMKAAAGNTIFARALEAYTANDSNGVIDAYIISPWD